MIRTLPQNRYGIIMRLALLMNSELASLYFCLCKKLKPNRKPEIPKKCVSPIFTIGDARIFQSGIMSVARYHQMPA